MAERRRADGHRTRERILETALPLFAERGFAGTSIRTVAQAADVNVATLAYHFTDKEGLYSTVVQRLHSELEEGWPVELEGATPEEMVGQLVATAWAFAMEHRVHIRLLMRHVLDQGAHPDAVVDRWAVRLLDRAEGLIGHFRPDWSRAECRWLVLSIQHLVVRHVLEDPSQVAVMIGAPVDEISETIPRFLTRLLVRELGLR